MDSALIGYSGFVGGTLLKQRKFGALYRSTNIGEIAGRGFETVVCAGAPAQKWLANKDPAGDAATIDMLIRQLDSVRCSGPFVLISTVDVFAQPVAVDEDTPVIEDKLHPYGLNRRRLEKFVLERFEHAVVVRLPGLVGPGLRKNVIYDFLHHNNVELIDSRGIFQFYPMVNLGLDIDRAVKAGLRIVHLTAEPVSVSQVARVGFGIDFENPKEAPPARYDFRTRHANLFGGAGNYTYSARETLLVVRAYAQSEPVPAVTVR